MECEDAAILTIIKSFLDSISNIQHKAQRDELAISTDFSRRPKHPHAACNTIDPGVMSHTATAAPFRSIIPSLACVGLLLHRI